MSKKLTETKKRKSKYDKNRSCYLAEDGSYVYEVVDLDTGAVRKERFVPEGEKAAELVIWLDEDDHQQDLSRRYDEENLDWGMENKRARFEKGTTEDEFDEDPFSQIKSNMSIPEASLYDEEEPEDPRIVKLREFMKEHKELFSAVEVDFENNLLINIRFQDSAVIIHKGRLPVFTLGLNDRLNDTTNDLLEEKVITCSTFKFLGSYTPYGDFLDGHDGYWYGFANQANSSGDAKMYWVKIKKDDYTMTEGVWTLSNACLKVIGSFKVDTYAQRSVRGVIRNGYLYLTAYDDTGIYKINLSNSTDVTLIPFGFTSEGKS